MNTFNANSYGSVRVKDNTKEPLTFSHSSSSPSSQTFNVYNETDENVKQEHKLLYPPQSIQPLSFQNRTFSIGNSMSNQNGTVSLPTSASSASFQAASRVNENKIANLLSMQKPVPPTRTISLRPHDVLDQKPPLSTSIRVQSFNYPKLGNNDAFSASNQHACTEHDVFRVESCYKSMGTQVFACQSIADLYSTNVKNLLDLSDWSHECTGIPLFVFNTGLNPKRKKCLKLVLADRLTGFALREVEAVTHANDFKWTKKNVITFKANHELLNANSSNYSANIQSLDRRSKKLPKTNTSTSLKSLDRTSLGKQQQQQLNNNQCLYALEFQNDFECSRFYDHYRAVAYDNKNKDLFDVNFKPKKSDSLIRVFCRRITKSAISGPCAFQHINSVPNLFKMFQVDEEEMHASRQEFVNEGDNASIASSTNTITDEIVQSNFSNENS